MKPEIRKDQDGDWKLYNCPRSVDEEIEYGILPSSCQDGCQYFGGPDIWRRFAGGKEIINQPKCHHPDAKEKPVPDKDGWIKWEGGKCPVGEGVMVDARFREWSAEDNISGVDLDWSHTGGIADIMYYRLHVPCESCNDEGGVTEHRCKSRPFTRSEGLGNWTFHSYIGTTWSAACCTDCGKELDKIPCDKCGKVRG